MQNGNGKNTLREAKDRKRSWWSVQQRQKSCPTYFLWLRFKAM
jgi:hypothetical protein